MAWLAQCALALFVGIGLGDHITSSNDANKLLAERQTQLMTLYFHINEPVSPVIDETWKLEEHIDQFKNATAVKKFMHMKESDWLLPRGVPFSISNEYHKYEAITLFHMLFSAKDYDTLYHAALYLRDKVNENLYVYILNVVLLHHPETQGFIMPPIYEVLPTYFNNAEIIDIAQRLNVHGMEHMDQYPMCYKWEENMVIKWNETLWPFYSRSTPIWYYTQDFELNAMYYFDQLAYPTWLGREVLPLWQDRRGEWTWFLHKQLLARYYMELLSNGMGEIPELGHHIVEEGFNSGLLHTNGVPFPVRNDYYCLEQPVWVETMEKIKTYERRIMDAMDIGYYVDTKSQHFQINSPDSIDRIWRLIESNVDSPNSQYYKDFIGLWKKVLGNSLVHTHYHNNVVPLEVPSVLELHQTALRDPAFYMIWKRVLDMFWTWQEKLPPYTKDELGCPSVVINQVQVDKLVTYFELDHMNISSLLYMDEHEHKKLEDKVSVLVEYPRLNHKVFTVRVNVNSEVAKKVAVRFFLAPKYDSHGHEIPLHKNTKNFFLFDQFIHELPQGESVIVRESTANQYVSDDWESGYAVYEKAFNAAQGKEPFVYKMSQLMNKFPGRLLIPKGRANGMPFILMVHIADYRPPKVELGKGFNQNMSYGFGTGALRLTADPLGFPIDRPLYPWIVKNLHNIVFQDVLIYHKHAPEIYVPHHE